MLLLKVVAQARKAHSIPCWALVMQPWQWLSCWGTAASGLDGPSWTEHGHNALWSSPGAASPTNGLKVWGQAGCGSGRCLAALLDRLMMESEAIICCMRIHQSMSCTVLLDTWLESADRPGLSCWAQTPPVVDSVQVGRAGHACGKGSLHTSIPLDKAPAAPHSMRASWTPDDGDDYGASLPCTCIWGQCAYAQSRPE